MLINGSELARRLGVSSTAVVKARQRGRIAYAEGKQLFDAQEAEAAFRATSRRTLAPEPTVVPEPTGVPVAVPATTPAEPTIRTWYDRRQRALAQHAERELALLEGRSLDRDRTIGNLAKIYGNIRQRLLALPSRVAPLVPVDQRQRVADAIEREVYAALNDLADGQDGQS
jgi:hypothetical protein